MKTVLSIDQSLTESGVCLMNDFGDYQTFVIKPKKVKGVDRLIRIREILKKVIDETRPDIIVMEGYSYGSVGRTFELGELGGVIKELVSSYHIPLEIIPPTVWKKKVCGKGNLNKDGVLLEVWKKYEIKFTNNNECDAWCLAKCVMNEVKQ